MQRFSKPLQIVLLYRNSRLLKLTDGFVAGNVMVQGKMPPTRTISVDAVMAKVISGRR